MRNKNRFQSLIHLGGAFRQFPQFPFTDALSVGQIESKKWLVETLEDQAIPLGNVFVLAGWWGLLPAMFFESSLKFNFIRSFDIDPQCASIADTMNRKYVMDGWKFKATTQDILEMNYREHVYKTQRADGTWVELSETPDTIINTSCEHIAHFTAWWEMIPLGKLVVLQNNNQKGIADHINCVDGLDDFVRSAPVSKLIYKGEHKLENYSRYMIVGVK